MSLYPDQSEIIEQVRAAMKVSKSILLQSPTGSGKTRMATHMIEAAKNKKRKIIMTVPRKDLLEQTSETFNTLGIRHGIIAAGKRFDPFRDVYIGMVDTMARRLSALPKCDLLIPDETHFGQGSLNAVINHYKHKGAWVLGLSATPWKLSGKGLGCWYDTMVQGKSISWLIAAGRLSNYRYFRGQTTLDTSRIPISGGDFAKGAVASFMEEQGVIVGDCVRDYKLRAAGRLHIVRCASVKASQMTAEKFREAGVPAVHVDGTTEMVERKRIFMAYARREILVLCFADLLNFGFDLSQASGGMDVCIEGCSDLKPSKSLAGQMQFWGRALRYKDFPAIINDHVNNYAEHGLPCDDRNWTLADRTKAVIESERAAPTRQCPKCFYCHSPAPICPNCNHVYEVQSRIIEEVEGELTEIVPGERRQLTDEESAKMQEAIDAVAANARRKGMPQSSAVKWATSKVRKQMGL
jgi:superfamily II DNA or RNA helicase